MNPNNFIDSDFALWKQGAKVEISKPGGVTGFQTGWLCMECGTFVAGDAPPAKCPGCKRKMLISGSHNGDGKADMAL